MFIIYNGIYLMKLFFIRSDIKWVFMGRILGISGSFWGMKDSKFCYIFVIKLVLFFFVVFDAIIAYWIGWLILVLGDVLNCCEVLGKTICYFGYSIFKCKGRECMLNGIYIVCSFKIFI